MAVHAGIRSQGRKGATSEDTGGREQTISYRARDLKGKVEPGRCSLNKVHEDDPGTYVKTLSRAGQTCYQLWGGRDR